MVHLNLDDDDVERLDELADTYTNGNRTAMASQLIGLFGESAVLRESVDDETPEEVAEGYYSRRGEVVEAFVCARDCSRSHAYTLASKSGRVHDVREVTDEVADEIEDKSGVIAEELRSPGRCLYYVPGEESVEWYVGDRSELKADIIDVVEQNL